MNIDFNKYSDGLVPAIIQDDQTNKVLMLGFMNQAAFTATLETQKVTFLVEPNNVYGLKGRKRSFFELKIIRN